MSPARAAPVISDEQLDEAMALLREPEATIASVSRKLGISDSGLRYALERRRGIKGRRYSKHLGSGSPRVDLRLRIEPDLHEQLAQRAERDSVSASEVVSRALRAYLEGASAPSPVVRVVNVSVVVANEASVPSSTEVVVEAP